MNNLVNKISATLTASTVLAMAVALETTNPAQAIEFNFSWKGDGGYSALGQFSYDETKAPSIISESGIGPTKYLDSLSVSFFDPSNIALGTYNTVAGGVSNSKFFTFNFDTSNKTLFGNFDIAGGGTIIGEYFLQGKIGSSLEFRQDINGVQSRLVDQNSGAITVSQVPEPASVLGLLAFGALGATVTRKKKLATQKAEA